MVSTLINTHKKIRKQVRALNTALKGSNSKTKVKLKASKDTGDDTTKDNPKKKLKSKQPVKTDKINKEANFLPFLVTPTGLSITSKFKKKSISRRIHISL